MTLGLINTNHVVHAKKERVAHIEDFHADDVVDPLDIYDFVRDIRDPEHPYSLEQLSVLSEESIAVDDKLGRILITFTPTIQHCSMATVIGLTIEVYNLSVKELPHWHLRVISVCRPSRGHPDVPRTSGLERVINPS
ncbi:protein AE7-like 1 isoform X2 [Malus domestica]|uniref:protein AE7-like 1 isoform X2 n=1 Tax=Malus domestica TaxID=3750 RepID=UPI003975D0A9